jgi:C_GCAxxG_C_C family probable redox protein
MKYLFVYTQIWRINMDDRASQRSLELFQSGFFCAESVLLAISEKLGIQSDLIPRIATGFCSGISRSSNNCGAISGAIMGINIALGRNAPAESLEKCFNRTQELMSLFEQQFGSVNCFQLIGCDLTSEDGQRAFMDKQAIESCYEYTRFATSAAISLIEK